LEPQGVEICPFPLLWILSFTTACTIVQAVIYVTLSTENHGIVFHTWSFEFGTFLWAVLPCINCAVQRARCRHAVRSSELRRSVAFTYLFHWYADSTVPMTFKGQIQLQADRKHQSHCLAKCITSTTQTIMQRTRARVLTSQDARTTRWVIFQQLFWLAESCIAVVQGCSLHTFLEHGTFWKTKYFTR